MKNNEKTIEFLLEKTVNNIKEFEKKIENGGELDYELEIAKDRRIALAGNLIKLQVSHDTMMTKKLRLLGNNV
jgi:hypothetical protein